MNKQSTPLAEAARELYRARTERTEAHAALLAFRQKHGGCKDESEICYSNHPDQNEWCETCLGSQPLWERRKKASARVGTALRNLMRVAGKEPK